MASEKKQDRNQSDVGIQVSNDVQDESNYTQFVNEARMYSTIETLSEYKIDGDVSRTHKTVFFR